MKKISALITVTVFAFSFSASSQHTETDDSKKMHIKIEIEKDGKTTKIDTTIHPQDLAALNEHLKDLDIHLGDAEKHFSWNFGHDFNFDFNSEKFKEHMKELQEKMKNHEFDSEEMERHMHDAMKNLKEHHHMFYKYHFDSDSLLEIHLEKLDKLLDENGSMNFNFNHDGKNKTIIIEGDDIKIDSDKGEKEIIMKSKATPDGKNQKHKESKKVIIIMKSSGAPEKPKPEFAAEPQIEEPPVGEGRAERVRVVEKKNDSWLSDLKLYPNPSAGEFTLSFRLSNPEPAELKIMDIAGREVFAESISENTERVEKQIKLSSNSSAAYLLILRQGNNWYHEKIFVRS